MGANVQQKHFFDWFYNEVTLKTVKRIRELHFPMPTPLGEDEEIPVEQRFIMWGDSDIPYLQQMMCTRIIFPIWSQSLSTDVATR